MPLSPPSGVRALFGPVTGGGATRHAPATRFVPFRNGGVPAIHGRNTTDRIHVPEGNTAVSRWWRASRHHRIASQNNARSRQGSKRLQLSIQRVRNDGRTFRSAVPTKNGLEYPLSNSTPLSPPSGVRALFGPVSGGGATRHAPATRFVPFRNGGVPAIHGRNITDSLHVPGGNTAVSRSVARFAPPPDRFAK